MPDNLTRGINAGRFCPIHANGYLGWGYRYPKMRFPSHHCPPTLMVAAISTYQTVCAVATTPLKIPTPKQQCHLGGVANFRGSHTPRCTCKSPARTLPSQGFRKANRWRQIEEARSSPWPGFFVYLLKSDKKRRRPKATSPWRPTFC
jgi:hypothetical protein